MSATFTSLRPIVQSDGSKLSEKEHSALTGLRVSNGLGTPAHARLTFTVTKESPSIGTKLGATLKIGVDGLRDDADHAVDWELFDGVVVSLGIELATGTTQTVVIEAYDKLYKLGRATVAKTYVNQKPADIITTLARDAGLSADIDSVFGGTNRSVAAYQYGTAYAYIDRLVRDEGCEWFVTQTKLHVRPPRLGVWLAGQAHRGPEPARFLGSVQRGRPCRQGHRDRLGRREEAGDHR